MKRLATWYVKARQAHLNSGEGENRIILRGGKYRGE